jgi:riboflavin synthase
MFTGLVENVGRIRSVERTDDGAVLAIETELAGELRQGDSIAVNGVCLTARDPGDGAFTADAMNETLARTSLGTLAAGEPVNLELPLAVGDRLGGHIVQGHVDGTGEVLAREPAGFAHTLRVGLPDGLGRYVVEKGSIAIDGVSLTVSALGDDWLEVSLIPETLERTTLGRAEPGRQVNLEVDVLAKHVERLVQHERDAK